MRTIASLLLLCGVSGCHDGNRADPVAVVAPSAPSLVADAPPPSAPPSAEPPARIVVPPAPPDVTQYPWHGDDSIEALDVVDHLEQRFAPPAGYQRVEVPADSFGAWLRRVPLAAEGTPVHSYDGRVLLEPGHRHLAAVTTLDIGNRDLQQCADAIMRLHGEWLWAHDRADEASYPTGKADIAWRYYGRRSGGHASYRRYMDEVFSWANTVSLARKTARVAREDVRPGDFFVLPGHPGHAVLVLDLARNEAGERVALIGQSYMPAQSFQVLRPSRDEIWFTLHDEGVDTPFWRRFPWDALRRLDA